jgi:flavin-dependent dehydrogenase
MSSIFAAFGLTLAFATAGEARPLRESPRELPIAYDVDVVVVGGTTGAVAAAVAASDAGARVFLAAPRPYLGDDMIATLRLWDTAAEQAPTPLARQILHDAQEARHHSHPDRLAIRYKADRPSASKHPDTDPPSKLTDGNWGDPTRDSVQFNNDVQISLDLEEVTPIRQVRVMTHYRDAENPEVAYKIDRIQIHSSGDGRAWHVECDVLPEASDRSFVLAIPLEVEARHLRLDFFKTVDAGRLLISEIEVVGEAQTPRSEALDEPRFIRPMHLKKTLDDALLKAQVRFLYGCYVTDVLRDTNGAPCGIVMANRAGRQAVLAKTIIDATQQATVARLAGATLRSRSTGPRTVKRIVIGGQPRSEANVAYAILGHVAKSPAGKLSSERAYPIVEYFVLRDLAEERFPQIANLEQEMRDVTYQAGQVRGAERCFLVPAHAIVTATPQATLADMTEASIGAFVPIDVPHVYVLGACAKLSTEDAERLMGMRTLTRIGGHLGKRAADEALRRAEITGASLPDHAELPPTQGDSREMLRGVRPTQELPVLKAGARRLPVLGKYDVVVIGGGTSGAPAGIAAARRGAKTLVVEYQEGLGGVGTVGLVGRYHRGNRVGFTAEVPAAGGEPKMEWWRSALRQAGGDIWFGALGCGAWVEDGRVQGAIVATPHGRGVVLAEVVVDATGNADIAVAAGAIAMTTDQHDIAVQGAGMPARDLGAVYTNTDYALVDDADLVDVWRILVAAKRKYATSYDLATLVQTRERRRVAGDFMLTYLDQMANRTYPDTIVQSTSNYDSHGYPSHPIFAAVRPAEGARPQGGTVYTPYRCLLPKGLEGILVIGLGCSAHRDAMALIRMQADLQNQGYAAGLAAAMAASERVSLRAIDMRRLQRELVAMGNLPESVLTDEDSFPLPRDEIAAAVTRLATADAPSTRDAAIVLSHQDLAVPLLRTAYHNAEAAARETCAILLAICGDATGQVTLVEALQASGRWDPKKPLGSMAEYSQLPTRQDALILALGFTGEPSGLPLILARAETLSPDVCLSHHRAVAQTLERFASREAAAVLADVLQRDGMTGHALLSVEDQASRIEPLREIVLARALFRCGDHESLGRTILEQYSQDLRGHLARHAKAVLDAEDEPR